MGDGKTLSSIEHPEWNDGWELIPDDIDVSDDSIDSLWIEDGMPVVEFLNKNIERLTQEIDEIEHDNWAELDTDYMKGRLAVYQEWLNYETTEV